MIPSTRTRQTGLTLIEILIALTLGLFLLGGVLQVYLGSKQTYRSTEALSRIQESGRFALEFMAYDVRMAGLTGCANTTRIANTVNNPSAWWVNFADGGIVGYAGADVFPGKAIGTAQGDRIAGTDAFILRGAKATSYSIVQHQETSAVFKLSALHDLQNGSIVMVCDNRQLSIVQLTNVNNSNVTIVHNTGTGVPGNCTQRLGYPSPVWPGECGPQAGTKYQYGPDSTLVEFNVSGYYIGVGSTQGTRSLYRVGLNITSTATGPQVEELVENVYDMRVLYGVDTTGNGQVDAYSAAGAVANWGTVIAARLCVLPYSMETNVATGALTLNCNGANIAIPDNRLAQVFDTTVGLRNRLP